MVGILLLNGFAALAVLIALPAYRLVRSIWEDRRIECGVREAQQTHEKAAREILALKERGEKIPWELRDEELRLSVDWIGAVMESYGRAPGWSEELRAKYPITTVHVGLEDLRPL